MINRSEKEKISILTSGTLSFIKFSNIYTFTRTNNISTVDTGYVFSCNNSCIVTCELFKLLLLMIREKYNTLEIIFSHNRIIYTIKPIIKQGVNMYRISSILGIYEEEFYKIPTIVLKFNLNTSIIALIDNEKDVERLKEFKRCMALSSLLLIKQLAEDGIKFSIVK